MRKVFRSVVTLEEAREVLKRFCRLEPKVEEVELLQALGRVAAEDIVAGVDVPPFDRAAMDGYAVIAEDTFGADEDSPVRLRVIGRVEAGENPSLELKRGEAVEIATGAAMPKNANAVVMVEHTRRSGDFVEVFKAVVPGENVMFAGSDIMSGELVVRKGSLITHREIGVLASIGVSRVKVFRKPRVAVISTGNELVKPGEELEFGKIYDVNSYAIAAAVAENGGEPIIVGIARDDEEEIAEKVDEGLRLADIVLTSGSTSAGVGDVMYRILDRYDPGVVVHGIAVKPGKPTIIAFSGEKPVIGLPGYPTSAITIFEVLVAPLIRELAGMGREERRVRARLAFKVFSAEGRREFLPVHLVSGEGLSAYPVLGSYSGAVSAFAFADGFIEVDERTLIIEEGEEVEVQLYSSLKPADLVVIGSHCVGVDLLLSLMRKRKPLTAKVINVGSTAGILAAKRGEADVAGTHLLDESGEYNVNVARRYGFRGYLVKGYLREQGLVVAKGNPKGIRGFEDLLREDVTFINRNRGSGTRILTDSYLSELAERLNLSFEELVSKIRGYNVEAKTHTSVAVAVASGKADVGVAIKSVAARYGLDFIPLRAEEYDFLIPKEKIGKESVQMFLDVLKSEEFSEELRKLEGLRTYERTGEIIEI